MPESHSASTISVKLNITSNGKRVYSSGYTGKNAVAQSFRDLEVNLVKAVIDDLLQQAADQMGELAFFIGDYLSEFMKSKMDIWGVTSPNVHIVTGSLMESMENQTPIRQGAQRSGGMVRAEMTLGFEPGASRYERSRGIIYDRASNVRPINTGEPVEVYGQAKVDQMATIDDLTDMATEELANIVASSERIDQWVKSAAVSDLRSRTLALQVENEKKIALSAQARISAAERPQQKR